MFKCTCPTNFRCMDKIKPMGVWCNVSVLHSEKNGIFPVNLFFENLNSEE